MYTELHTIFRHLQLRIRFIFGNKLFKGQIKYYLSIYISIKIKRSVHDGNVFGL